MKYDVGTFFSRTDSESMLGTGGTGESTSGSNARKIEVSVWRGLALLMLSIPAIAFAPWKGGDANTSGADQANDVHDIGIPASAASVSIPEAQQAAISSSIGNGSDATILAAVADGYGSFPWNNSSGIGLPGAIGGSVHVGTTGNARFGGRGNSFRGAGGGLPSDWWAGFPSVPHPAGGLGSGGGGRSASAARNADGSPNDGAVTPSDSSPLTESPDAATPPALVARTAPENLPVPGNEPLPGTLPIVDDPSLALPDDPELQSLLPPTPDFPGDTTPGVPSFLDPLDRPVAAEPIVAIAAVPAPGTGLLMAMAFPLLLFFRRRVG